MKRLHVRELAGHVTLEHLRALAADSADLATSTEPLADSNEGPDDVGEESGER